MCTDQGAKRSYILIGAWQVNILYPDGSVGYWPEWTQTVPQSQWTPEQVAFMREHQQRYVDAMKRQSEKVLGPAEGKSEERR
jgi:hypothetical protein